MEKFNKKFLFIFVIILFIIFISTISYSVLYLSLNISGVTNTRFTKDVRIVDFSIYEASDGTISSYEEYNKDSILSHINFSNTSSYIIFNVTLRNYGDVKMGIKEILGMDTNFNLDLIDYKLHDVIKDVGGNTKGGATKTFKIKISPKNPSFLEIGLNLKFKYSILYDVKYTMIQDNNYPQEVMEGDDFSLTFTDPIPEYLDVFIDNNYTENYNYTKPNFTIKNVRGNLNIKLSERVYLKKSGSGEDFKENYNIRDGIKTVSFVKYDNSSDSTNLGTWDMSEGQDRSVMAWVDKNYNLFIGSNSKIYGKNMSSYFYSLSSVTSFDFSNLYTGEVTNMSNMFYGCNFITKLDISNFDIRKCSYFYNMFSDSNNIIEITIGNNYIFTAENAFPQSKYGTWYNSKKQLVSLEQISGHSDTYTIFIPGVQFPLDKYYLNKSTLRNLTGKISISNTKLPTGQTYNFSLNANDTVVAVVNAEDAIIYNTINDGKVKIIADCSNLFDNYKIGNLDLQNLDTSNVTNMENMFYHCMSLKTIDLSSFNTSHVINMSNMFLNCIHVTSLDVSNFDTSKVTDMQGMFCTCGITSLDLSSFDTSNVTSMDAMFNWNSNLVNLNLKSFVTSNVTNMRGMFSSCNSLTSLDLSSFDISHVIYMDNMFRFCESLTNLDLSSFDTSHVIYMSDMFEGCESLTNLNLKSFVTSNVISMIKMFQDCNSLTSLDLSSFDFTKTKYMDSFLNNSATSLTVYYNTQASLDKIKASSDLNPNITFVQKNPI